MKEIELIRIRCAHPSYDRARQALNTVLAELPDEIGDGIRLFGSSTTPTDMLVLIDHQGRESHPDDGTVGTAIETALQSLGLVNRTAWRGISTEIPETRDQHV